jgi:hypothetical protein
MRRQSAAEIATVLVFGCMAIDRITKDPTICQASYSKIIIKNIK